MATVTVYTAARMQQIEDETVIGGEIVGNDLILETRNAAPINAGNVRGPQGIQGPIGEVSDAELTSAINALDVSLTADIDALRLSLPWGNIGSAKIESASAAIGTMADISGLSVTFTAVVNRLYIAHFGGTIQGQPGDRVDILITDGANVGLKTGIVIVPSGNVFFVDFGTAPFQPGAGSFTCKIRAQQVSGTGDPVLAAAAANPCFIRVQDIGPA